MSVVIQVFDSPPMGASECSKPYKIGHMITLEINLAGLHVLGLITLKTEVKLKHNSDALSSTNASSSSVC